MSTCGDLTCQKYHQTFSDTRIRIGIPSFLQFACDEHFVKHTEGSAFPNTSVFTDKHAGHSDQYEFLEESTKDQRNGQHPLSKHLIHSAFLSNSSDFYYFKFEHEIEMVSGQLETMGTFTTETGKTYKQKKIESHFGIGYYSTIHQSGDRFDRKGPCGTFAETTSFTKKNTIAGPKKQTVTSYTNGTSKTFNRRKQSATKRGKLCKLNEMPVTREVKICGGRKLLFSARVSKGKEVPQPDLTLTHVAPNEKLEKKCQIIQDVLKHVGLEKPKKGKKNHGQCLGRSCASKAQEDEVCSNFICQSNNVHSFQPITLFHSSFLFQFSLLLSRDVNK